MALPYGEISFQSFNLDRSLPATQQVIMTDAAAVYGVSYNTSGTDALSMDEFWQGQVIFNTYTGCGRGNTAGETCNDVFSGNRTFYSNIGPFDLTYGSYTGGGYIYTDLNPTVLTGYSYVYINGAVWNVNNSTGQIISYADGELQC